MSVHSGPMTRSQPLAKAAQLATLLCYAVRQAIGEGTQLGTGMQAGSGIHFARSKTLQASDYPGANKLSAHDRMAPEPILKLFVCREIGFVPRGQPVRILARQKLGVWVPEPSFVRRNLWRLDSLRLARS